MFDALIRPYIDAPLSAVGRRLARLGADPDAVTLIGFAAGVAAAGAIATGQFAIAVLMVGLNRLLDGLDGAVARARGKTDRGGFLDITLDFAFYGLIPLAFAVLDPATNALPAAAVLASFYVNGAGFLAFAVLAQKRGLETKAQGEKSLFYIAGLAEGTETVLVFLAWCLFPAWFAPLAYGFAALTGISAVARIVAGAKALR